MGEFILIPKFHFQFIEKILAYFGYFKNRSLLQICAPGNVEFKIKIESATARVGSQRWEKSFDAMIMVNLSYATVECGTISLLDWPEFDWCFENRQREF